MRLFLWLQSSPFIIYPRTHCGLSVLSVWVIKPSWVNINYYSIRLIKRREEYWAGGSIPLQTLSNLKQYICAKKKMCVVRYFLWKIMRLWHYLQVSWGFEMVINMEIFHLQDGKLAVVEWICQEIETEMIYSFIQEMLERSHNAKTICISLCLMFQK